MKYESVRLISTYLQGLIGIGIGIITVRGVHIASKLSSSLEDGISLSSILSKLGNRIKAIVILVIVEALIEYVKTYLF